jgi:hypothetical protein
VVALQNWRATAFNQATDSSNQIHSDDMARAYGFKGGLVPGVTISSYLMHPAVVSWGEAWLSRGFAHVVVSKPLYDGFSFEVQVTEASDTAYRAVLVDQEGTQCATGFMRLNDELPAPPVRRGDAILAREADIPPVSREVLEKMRVAGMHALPARWNAEHNMATYLHDPAGMPELLRFDGGGFANGAFMLGLTNWVLAGNTYMNPWVHVQTDSQFFAPVRDGEDLLVECAVQDLFEKKGHQFVDAQVDVYRRADDAAVMTAVLRAIYKLRPPAG